MILVVSILVFQKLVVHVMVCIKPHYKQIPWRHYTIHAAI